MRPTWKNWCARLFNPGSAQWSPDASPRAQLLEELLLNESIARWAGGSESVRIMLSTGFGLSAEDVYGRLLLSYVAQFREFALDESASAFIRLSPEERARAQRQYVRRASTRLAIGTRRDSGVP